MHLHAVLSALALTVSSAAVAGELKPMLAIPDKVVLQDDFSKTAPLNPKQWGPRQGTRWAVADGVLHGQASTPEYQASHKDHKGFEPRIASSATPVQFIAEFSVRFQDGKETALSPFIEFGHHVCRLKLGSKGLAMVVDHESTQVASAPDFKYEPGKWYHVLAEHKGDEIVVQFEGGPTLYGKHECLAKPSEKGASGVGLAGPQGGTVDIDNVTLWSIKPEASPGWAAAREKLPKTEPKTAKTKKTK